MKRVVKDIRRIVLDPTEQTAIEPVLVDVHVPDAAYIKHTFEERVKAHKQALLSIAISYMAALSAIGEVTSDIKEVMAQDFQSVDDVREEVNGAFDRAVILYLNRHSLQLTGASQEEVASICAGLFVPATNQPTQPRLTTKDLVEAMGLAMRPSQPTDPYAARPPFAKEE